MISYDTIQVVVCLYASKRPRSLGALFSFMRSVRTYLNLSQLLSLLGTKAKYVRENTVGTSCTPRSISGLYCCMPQILRVFYVSRGSVLMRVVQVYFKYFVRWFVLRVLAVPKYSQYAQ